MEKQTQLFVPIKHVVYSFDLYFDPHFDPHLARMNMQQNKF